MFSHAVQNKKAGHGNGSAKTPAREAGAVMGSKNKFPACPRAAALRQ
jgi:hypothetical protein